MRIIALALLVLCSTFRQTGARSSVRGDPHFVGKLGVQFDFHGELDKTFCLVTDKALQINALLRGYRDKRPFGAAKPDAKGYRIRSWIKELGVIWRSTDGETHVLRLVARPGPNAERGDGFLKQVELDGEAQALPYSSNSTVERAGLKFFFTGTVARDGQLFDTFQLYIADLLDASVLMRPANKQLETPNDAEVHFNVDIKYLHATQSVHGVLGQTYRPTDEQTAKAVQYSLMTQWVGQPVEADESTGDASGFLDGDVKDYITSGISKTDCKYSAF